MFTQFLYALRKHGVPVGTQEWLALHDALGRGMVEDEQALYGLGRALLVHTEGHYDSFDLAFLEVFHDIEGLALREAIKKWLENPIPMGEMSAEAFQQLTGMSLEELRQRFEELLEEQTERHDGGNKWIGTGGTSPFGHSGRNPQGFRVGGPGGGRGAVQVAAERRYRDHRSDVTLDVRQFKTALRALRSLTREGPEILDLDGTIDKTCKQGGEIELDFQKDRKNRVRLVLLMDAGGSMDPYARLVDRLFTAASEIGHWKSMDHYYFHNVVYSRLYTSIERLSGVQTEELLRKHPDDCKFVFVGDACMAPWELHAAGGIIAMNQRNVVSGLDWLKRFRTRWKDMIWLNPEPERYWRHETISAIGNVIPMYPLTLDGLRDGIRLLRQGGQARAFPAA